VRSLYCSFLLRGETTCDELTTAPIAHPPVLLEGRRRRKSG